MGFSKCFYLETHINHWTLQIATSTGSGKSSLHEGHVKFDEDVWYIPIWALQDLG